MKRLQLLLMLGVGVAVGFLCGAAVTVVYGGQLGFDYNQVVAKVGETSITRGRLAERAIMSSGVKLLDGELKSQALIAEAARVAKVTVSRQEVEARIDAYLQMLEKYDELSELLGTRKAVDALPRWYLEDQYYHTLLAEKLLKITVTNDDVNECYYKNLKQFQTPDMAKLVYIATDDFADAKRALTGLKEGEKPRKISVKYSSIPELKDVEGDIGWCAQTGMRPEFSEAVFRGKNGKPLGPNEYTGIITTTEGDKENYVIFYVEDFQAGKKTDLSEVRPAVEFVARMMKLNKVMDEQKWMALQESKFKWQRVKNLSDPAAVPEDVEKKTITK